MSQAYKARVFVTLKPSVFDPQGRTITDALQSMGYGTIGDVRQGKFFELQVSADSKDAAKTVAGEVAHKLLANPVIESYRVEVVERPVEQSIHAMKFAVIVFPGSNCDHDAYHAAKHVLGQECEFVWHKETDLKGADVVILPGGFAHGDYLRTGAIARFSPVIEPVTAFAAAGNPVIGICNGFQVLLEAGLLEGAMLRNRDKYRCEHVRVRVEHTDTPFTLRCQPGQILRIPIAHGEGNYYAEPETLARLEKNRQVIFRYVNEQGEATDESNPNGAIHNIAGICNAARNVVGLMPHPERACESMLGSADGLVMFESVIASMKSGVAA